MYVMLVMVLYPQVINAARVLAARPRSKAAQENMDVFKDAWEKQVRLLTEAVDDITTIHDFLAVSGTWFCYIFHFFIHFQIFLVYIMLITLHSWQVNNI